MLQRISALSLTVYFALKGLIPEIKKDERGLSGVVVAILLILIAVLAVVLIWGFLGEWIEKLWERITSETQSLSAST